MLKKIIVAFGTRPEAIKMIPVYKELKKYPSLFEVQLVVSGQHQEMLKQVLDSYDVVPDVDFKIMEVNQTLDLLISRLQDNYSDLFIKEEPDFVFVHGDTTTALVAALMAAYHKIKVCHVEAGLRTNDISNPFPEELNRQLIGRLASIHFAPTIEAKENLLRENVQGEIVVTGNTAIDSLFLNLKTDFQDEFLKTIEDNKMIILTTHRRENLGTAMEDIFGAVKEISERRPDYSIVYPVHMNPKIKELAYQMLADSPNVYLLEPLDVNKFHHYLQKSKIILTDSGGVQEEAPALKKPVLVLRNTTERPEGVASGTLKLIGTDKENIINEVEHLLTDSEYYSSFTKAINPYGDGKASKKIVDFLKDSIN